VGERSAGVCQAIRRRRAPRRPTPTSRRRRRRRRRSYRKRSSPPRRSVPDQGRDFVDPIDYGGAARARAPPGDAGAVPAA
jgi:hypothetical protein